jgi:internalin A
LQQENWKVIRDKDELEYGDQISDFMKMLGQARLVIVVLSEKYLRSPYCMTSCTPFIKTPGRKDKNSLTASFRLCSRTPTSVTGAVAQYAEHWESEFKAMEQHFTHLGVEDLKLYKAMRRWHNEVGDMLAYVNDILSPHGFVEIVKHDFAGLRQMLQRHR